MAEKEGVDEPDALYYARVVEVSGRQSSMLSGERCFFRMKGRRFDYPMRTNRNTQEVTTLAARVRDLAHPLRSAKDLDPLLERVGNARQALLGEASHGTSDY